MKQQPEQICPGNPVVGPPINPLAGPVTFLALGNAWFYDVKPSISPSLGRVALAQNASTPKIRATYLALGNAWFSFVKPSIWPSLGVGALQLKSLPRPNFARPFWLLENVWFSWVKPSIWPSWGGGGFVNRFQTLRLRTYKIVNHLIMFLTFSNNRKV